MKGIRNWIVDTKGLYAGVYDKIGVKITTAGIMGTAVYSYWAGDSTNLGAERMNNGDSSTFSDTVNGTYQPVGSGLGDKDFRYHTNFFK